MSKTLVLFDFDGTLTKRDSFLQFIFFSRGYLKGITGFLVFSPLIFLFLIRAVKGSVLKEKLISFHFKGKAEKELKNLGRKFIEQFLVSGQLNDTLVKEMLKYKSESGEVCIVSASLNIWIEPFCEKHSLASISTELCFENGIFSGKFCTPNCNGAEKAVRIKQKYNLKEYSNIIAYGNSKGDAAMFSLANKAIKV